MRLVSASRTSPSRHHFAAPGCRLGAQLDHDAALLRQVAPACVRELDGLFDRAVEIDAPRGSTAARAAGELAHPRNVLATSSMASWMVVRYPRVRSLRFGSRSSNDSVYRATGEWRC